MKIYVNMEVLVGVKVYMNIKVYVKGEDMLVTESSTVVNSV